MTGRGGGRLHLSSCIWLRDEQDQVCCVMIWPVHKFGFAYGETDLRVVKSSLFLLLMLSEIQELFIHTSSAVQ